MIYYTIALLLLTGCVAEDNFYNPTSWPRTVVMESELRTDTEIEYVERVKRAIAMLNKRVGAAVYQLAVTSDAAASGCNTLEIAFVDEILNADGTVRPGARGTYFPNYWPCKSYIQLRIPEAPSDSPFAAQPDESVVVHELMHDLLGGEHDDLLTKPHSVFSISSGCLADDPSVGYERLPYCTDRLTEEITDELVDRIRTVMGLPPA